MTSPLGPLRLLQRIPAASLLARRAFSSTPRAANLEADADPVATYRAFQRKNEDDKTLRARLIYQSRYRGTLESDLLLSTFAAAHLPKMTRAQLETYDQFLLEEDWDIYYWATQDLEPTASTSTSSASEPASSSPSPSSSSGPAAGRAPTQDIYKRSPPPGEWARIAGNFQAGYRPVPDRWRDSELLAKLRQHVVEKSATTGDERSGGMSARPLLFREGHEKE